MTSRSRLLVAALALVLGGSVVGCPRDTHSAVDPRSASEPAPPGVNVPATPGEPVPDPDPDVPTGPGWLAQESNSLTDITSVASNDGFNAWAAGDAMLRTIDGGTTWTSPVGNGGFKRVEFADTQNGWSITESQILSSLDGGQAWVIRKTALENPFVDLAVINPAVVVVLAKNDELYRTIDGGITWTTIPLVPLSPPVERELRAVEFVAGAIGWIVARDVETGGEAIYGSVDGGLTWKKQFVLAGALLTDISAVSAVEAWVSGISFGGAGIMLATTDGGETWVQQQVGGPPGGLRAVHFVNPLVGWAVGSSILHTENGGATWTLQPSPAGITFFDVDFVNEAVGWAVGSNGTILKTTTGGKGIEVEDPLVPGPPTPPPGVVPPSPTSQVPVSGESQVPVSGESQVPVSGESQVPVQEP